MKANIMESITRAVSLTASMLSKINDKKDEAQNIICNFIVKVVNSPVSPFNLFKSSHNNKKVKRNDEEQKPIINEFEKIHLGDKKPLFFKNQKKVTFKKVTFKNFLRV